MNYIPLDKTILYWLLRSGSICRPGLLIWLLPAGFQALLTLRWWRTVLIASFWVAHWGTV
jgi:hypothetical protein